jgi:hypothetical protein
MATKRPLSPKRKSGAADSRSASKGPSRPVVIETRKQGVYQNNDKQCKELTTQYGRCKNTVITGTMFCTVHQRKPKQDEDAFFDSTTAKVCDMIWIGSLDTLNDPNALRAAGIKSIVNISGWEPSQKTREMHKKLGIRYHTLTYRDNHGRLQYLGDEPLTDGRKTMEFYAYMDRGVDIMRRLPKGPVLINCFAGINRSASLVAAHLMVNRGFSFAQAEALLQKANAKRKVPVLTNKHFVQALKNYHQHRTARRQT